MEEGPWVPGHRRCSNTVVLLPEQSWPAMFAAYNGQSDWSNLLQCKNPIESTNLQVRRQFVTLLKQILQIPTSSHPVVEKNKPYFSWTASSYISPHLSLIQRCGLYVNYSYPPEGALAQYGEKRGHFQVILGH